MHSRYFFYTHRLWLRFIVSLTSIAFIHSSTCTAVQQVMTMMIWMPVTTLCWNEDRLLSSNAPQVNTQHYTTAIPLKRVWFLSNSLKDCITLWRASDEMLFSAPSMWT